MNYERLKLVMLAVAILFYGCSKQVNPAEYVQWIKNSENGLIVKDSFHDIEYKLMYKPIEYAALLEQQSINIDKAQLEQDLSELSGMQYYTFSISSLDHKQDVLAMDIQSKDEYFARLNYFTSIMQDDIYLEQGSEKLPCQMFHYERDYNLSPYQNFVLAFSLPQKDKDKNSDRTLVFNDRVLSKKIVKLTIVSKNIDGLPKLAVN